VQALCPCYARTLVRRALVIVAKAPLAGATKTRLVPPLSEAAAAELSRAFLLDTLAVARALEWERIALMHPRGHGPVLRSLCEEVALVEQPAEGLCDALTYAFEHHFALGYDRVILIGSDNPTLSAAPIVAAEQAQDLAIGPTRDGGYYLIGMRQPHPELFVDIEWSTPRVFSETLFRARELRLQVDLVQEWYDVDEAADLDVLINELNTLPSSVAAHTRAVLDRYEDGWPRSAAQGVGVGDPPGNLAGMPAARQDHH